MRISAGRVKSISIAAALASTILIASSISHATETGDAFVIPLFPPPMNPGLTLIGGRLCYFFERRVASYMYKADSHLMSLYIMSVQNIEPPPSSSGLTLGDRPMAIREADGFAHVLWKERQLYYSLVSDQPASRLIAVARAMTAVAG